MRGLALASVLVFGAAAGAAQVVVFEDFDAMSDIDDWKLRGPTYSSKTWDTEDSGGNVGSGSLRVSNEATIAFVGASFEYCLAVQPRNGFIVRLASRIPTGQSTSGKVSLILRYTSEPDCFGSLVGTGASSGLLTSPGTVWQMLGAQISEAPTDAVSLSISVLVIKTEDFGSLDALVDDVLVEQVPPIFVDGFESGNTSEWSSVTP